MGHFKNIPVLFQNNDILVVDKPFGISIHNAEEPENLMDVLTKEQKITKLYPVHRLDKETSGVQIFALNERSAKKYSETFQSHTVKKFYIGILRGRLNDSTGVWKQKLTDKAEGRKNPAGLAQSRVSCETHYKVLEGSAFLTLCEFDLKTGRQHQIRKHAALSKHHLVGDTRYGDKAYNQRITDLYNISRMFLHCWKIQLEHHMFEATVPEEFKVLMNKSKKNKESQA